MQVCKSGPGCVKPDYANPGLARLDYQPLSGKEPALLPRTHGWTWEDSFVSLSQSVNRPQIFVTHKLSIS